jgi:hypothetical protein
LLYVERRLVAFRCGVGGLAQVDALAKRWGVGRSEAIRRLLAFGVRAHPDSMRKGKQK